MFGGNGSGKRAGEVVRKRGGDGGRRRKGHFADCRCVGGVENFVKMSLMVWEIILRGNGLTRCYRLNGRRNSDSVEMLWVGGSCYFLIMIVQNGSGILVNSFLYSIRYFGFNCCTYEKHINRHILSNFSSLGI